MRRPKLLLDSFALLTFEAYHVYSRTQAQMKKKMYSVSSHYRNSRLCRVPVALPSAFYRALGKSGFAECGTRQRHALGKELVYRV
jgi:hypothetical protein